MFIAMLPDCRLIDGMVSAFAAGKVQAAQAGEQTAARRRPGFWHGVDQRALQAGDEEKRPDTGLAVRVGYERNADAGGHAHRQSVGYVPERGEGAAGMRFHRGGGYAGDDEPAEHFEIRKPMVSYYEHNKRQRGGEILVPAAGGGIRRSGHGCGDARYFRSGGGTWWRSVMTRGYRSRLFPAPARWSLRWPCPACLPGALPLRASSASTSAAAGASGGPAAGAANHGVL